MLKEKKHNLGEIPPQMDFALLPDSKAKFTEKDDQKGFLLSQSEKIKSLFEIGKSHYFSSQYTEALIIFDQILTLDPKNLHAYNWKAFALDDLNRRKESEAACQQVLELTIKVKEAADLTERSYALWRLQRYQDALIALNTALKSGANNAYAYTIRGNALWSLGRYSEALVAYEAALKRGSDFAYARTGYGNALWSLGRYSEALTVFEETLKCTPDFAYAHIGLGNTLLSLGFYSKALTAFEAVLKHNPDFIYAHTGRGIAFFGQKNYSATLMAYEQVIVLDCKNIIQDDHDIVRKKLDEKSLLNLVTTKLTRIIQKDITMPVLYLKDYQIDSTQAQSIAHQLKENQTVKHVILDRNPVQDTGLAALAEMLEGNTQIVTLSLENITATVERQLLFLPRIENFLQRNRILAKGSSVSSDDLMSLDTDQLKPEDMKQIAERCPVAQLDFSKKALNKTKITPLRWLQYMNTLTILNLSHNQLEDEAAQSLANYLQMNTTLTRIDLGFNQITEYGALEILQKTRQNTRLNLLDFSHNWLYVLPEKFKNFNNEFEERTIEHKEGMVKLKVNVSQNYFTRPCADLLAKHSIFYSLGKQVSEGGYGVVRSRSLLCKEEISHDYYLVFLLRKNGQDRSGDPEHAMILIEGMLANGQKFIQMYDFRPDNENHSGGGKVGGKVFLPHRMGDEVMGYDYVCYPTTRIKVSRLEDNIKADKKKTLYYKKLFGGVVAVASKRRVYNCLTWAISKLNESIMPPGEHIWEPAFLPIPSFYLQGQRLIETLEKKQEDQLRAQEQSYCLVM